MFRMRGCECVYVWFVWWDNDGDTAGSCGVTMLVGVYGSYVWIRVVDMYVAY